MYVSQENTIISAISMGKKIPFTESLQLIECVL